MGETESPTTTQYRPVTVDVPEDRVAEFHRFFGLFLAGGPGARRRGRHRGGPGRHGGYGRHGHHCGHDPEAPGTGETTAPAAETGEA